MKIFKIVFATAMCLAWTATSPVMSQQIEEPKEQLIEGMERDAQIKELQRSLNDLSRKVDRLDGKVDRLEHHMREVRRKTF